MSAYGLYAVYASPNGNSEMFIQTEETPNPATLKFLPGIVVLPSGTVDLRKGDDLSNSPLAMHLFEVDGVEAVFFGYDFITITKAASMPWPHLKPAVLGAIMEHFMAGQPVVPSAPSRCAGWW